LWGLNIGLLVGAITNSKGKKKDNKYHQPGGCLIYFGIPIAGFLLALNTLAWNLDADTPHLPWLIPVLIMLSAIFITVMIALIRKQQREEKKNELELANKRWLESFQGKRHT
jgi:hypothetical protein